ncbi:endonuclease/exonuclease/phosphatase family protein [Nesterenkonia muleiensis]|uniref:endonuclease/exonuclease/phosphatase family protein n=1 Tax=Nesterenkonia muleiensis TaxID=2282648 RepID=UPI00192E3E43|nr:endonuclease/exonuclease/phosphatase family protein [Nesterenkonia muleiensis]
MSSSPHTPGVRPKPLVGHVGALGLHVMSWNIRRRGTLPSLRPADRWAVRAPGIRALLRAEGPTLLGLQEALADQAFFAQHSLGENYRIIGRGRGARGRGEGTPILYDAERLQLQGWDQRALSKTPRRPGSRSWGSLHPRIMVSATFRDRVTGSHFLAINTHLDHLSARARLMGAHTIGRALAATSFPAVLTGDLNTGAGTKPIQELCSGSTLADTWQAAEHRRSQEWDTFANYQPPRARGRRIDWIFASSPFRVHSAAVNAQRYAEGWPSDHLPVHAVISLP